MYDESNLENDLKKGLVKEVFVLPKYHFDKIPKNIAKEFNYIGKPINNPNSDRNLIYLKTNGFNDVIYKRCYVLLIKNNAPGIYGEIIKIIEHKCPSWILRRKIEGLEKFLNNVDKLSKASFLNVKSYLDYLKRAQ